MQEQVLLLSKAVQVFLSLKACLSFSAFYGTVCVYPFLLLKKLFICYIPPRDWDRACERMETKRHWLCLSDSLCVCVCICKICFCQLNTHSYPSQCLSWGAEELRGSGVSGRCLCSMQSKLGYCVHKKKSWLQHIRAKGAWTTQWLSLELNRCSFLH